MATTVRFGVSMDSSQVAMLDEISSSMGHENRSETIRNLIRQYVVESASIQDDRRVVGTLTLTYRFGKRLPTVLLADYPTLRITTNIKTPVNAQICVKVLVLTGRADEVRSWSRKLIGARDVVGQLTVAATDQIVEELAGE